MVPVAYGVFGICEKNIPAGQFQWFIEIFSYLQFVMGKTVSNVESQRYEVHVSKVRKTKEKSIVISDFKTDVLPILGGLGEGKESTTPLIAICTHKIWNAHDRVRGVYPRAYKSLQYQRLNINFGINREMGCHMEARLLEI